MSEFLSAIWLPHEQKMVYSDLKQHHISWQEVLRLGYTYEQGHEFTWPADDDGSSIRIRALGVDGMILRPGSAEYETMRCQILRLWPTRDDLLASAIHQRISPDGTFEGTIDLSCCTKLTPGLQAALDDVVQVTGTLDLSSLQSAPEGFLPKLAQTGDLDLSSLQSAPEGFLPKLAQTGTLDISSDKLRRAIRAITTHNRGAAEVPSR